MRDYGSYQEYQQAQGKADLPADIAGLKAYAAEGTSTDCPKCGRSMQPVDVDLYRCPGCGNEVDMLEEDEL